MAAAARDFLLLLNESLLPHVVGLPTPARRRFREKLEFLGAGLWDSGVRVKKLKGLSRKVVFEARMGKGDRLLFTLGRDRERSLVYVWSLVSHDDISRGARSVGAQNAPFLHFDAEVSEDRGELTLTELSESYYSQEPLEAKVREEYGPQKWLVLDDAEWERLLRASDPDDLAVHLYLTREQERVLSVGPPLLLSGTAGSGKSTICVYYLLRPDYRESRRLFVTYSPFLRSFSERIYRGLVRHSVAAESAGAPEFLVFRELVARILGEESEPAGDRFRVAGYAEFERIHAAHPARRSFDPELVWEEIRSIIKGAKPALSPQRLRTLTTAYLGGGASAPELGELAGMLLDLKRLELFRELEKAVPDYDALVRGLAARRRTDAERRLLSEASGLLDRRSGRLAGPLLSYGEYAALGAKRAPNFRYDRKLIYALAEHYQGRLEENGAEDDIDRARRALARLVRGGEATLYDLVVCDEVQDLCDLEMTLLLRLARTAGGILLAGDVKQIINPSGFRWEEVRRGFYERGLEVPEVFQLSLNFRSVGGIVRLANAVLELKQKLVGLTATEGHEDWKFNGRPPLLLSGLPEDRVLAAADLRVAGRIVIVRSREEKERLRAALGSELVFTIHEAKGLEFDTALVWRFISCSEVAGVWRQVVARGEVDPEHVPHVRQELNLLYVALTRARNGLALYEDPTSPGVWQLDSFRDLLYRATEPAELERLWQRASSPEDWERQGDYFLEREYWKAAEECYRNAGNQSKAEVARARQLEAEGRHADAAPLYERSGMRERAAACWEAAGELGRAMELWKALGQGERFRLCRVRLYEKQGEHERAAEEWERLGNTEGALRNWELGGMWDRVGRYWSEWKQYRRAADAFERAGLTLEAARNLEKGKEHGRAADLYVRARAYERAAALYRRVGDEEKLLECLQKIPDHREVARLQEKRGELDRALSSFVRFAAQSEANALSLRSELGELHEGRGGSRRTLTAALIAAALGEHAQAARLFEGAGRHEIAYREWREASDPLGMARSLAALGRPAEAARVLEQSDPGQRDLISEYLDQSLGTDVEPDRRRIEELVKEAERLERAGDIDAALLRYRLFDATDKLIELYARVDRDEEALDRLLEGEAARAALQFLERKPLVRVSAGYVARLLERSTKRADSGRPVWFDADMVDVCARVFLSCVDREPVFGEAARAFLDAWRASYFDFGEIPESLRVLMLRLRHYNAIQALLRPPLGRGAPDEPSRRFLAEVRALADASGDQALLACWASAVDAPLHDSLLEKLELTERTVGIFEASPGHHRRAAEHHLAKGAWRSAAAVHLRWREKADAAAIHEAQGEARLACRLYREAGAYERLLECARRAGDEPEMARAYEGLGQYQRAIDTWASLGHTRDVERLRRKRRMANAAEGDGDKPQERQLGLFGSD